MMKFVWVLVAGLVGGVSNKLMFWMSSGLIILGLLVISTEGSFFIGHLYLSGGVAADQITFSLIILSLLVTILMFFSSNGVYVEKVVPYFYFFVYGLMLVLIFTFIMNNLLTFYFFFEFTLVPSLLIIMGWGYQPERLQAGVYFLFYTLGASLPLLLVMVQYSKMLGGVDIFDGMLLWGSNVGGWIFFFSVMAFMVSMPMFFIHLWLPSAHVEAPVSGSMILAGVLLKLGGYGIYRVLVLVNSGLIFLGSYFWGLSVLGMIYVGLMCCRLSDMKGLVAYSSVAHMGMVICGLVSYSYWGFSGALAMMAAHGVCSSGLFCAVNIYYERSGSRAFYLNSGLLSITPSMTLLFFMLCGANMAMPPTINLLSEIFLMGSMINFDYLMLVGFPLGSYLGAIFTLFLFSYTQHGSGQEGASFGSKINFREFNLMVVHILPVNLLVLKPEFFFSLV